MARVPGKFGKCVLKKQLGKGATALVFLAEHEGLGIQVAVKVLRKQLSKTRPEYAQRFLREARTAARLEHPNIVRVIDCGVQSGYHYMVMDYVDGKDCMEMLRKQPEGLPWRTVVEVARQAADGLSYAVENGIIHRDVKPSNLMIDSNGRVRVTDLGLAKLTVEGVAALTQELHTVGTPNYMSPEQIRKPSDIDVRADIYSLGATSYHLVTARPPFVGDNPMEVVSKHLTEPLTPPYKVKRGLPAGLSKVICKMMAKNPDRRYQDYEQLMLDLDNLLIDKDVSAQDFEETYHTTEEDEKLVEMFERLASGERVEIEDADETTDTVRPEQIPETDGSPGVAPFEETDFTSYESDSPEGDSTVLARRGQPGMNVWLLVVLVGLAAAALVGIALALAL